MPDALTARCVSLVRDVLARTPHSKSPRRCRWFWGESCDCDREARAIEEVGRMMAAVRAATEREARCIECNDQAWVPPLCNDEIIAAAERASTGAKP